MTVTVRAPTADDAEALARINIEAWRDAYTGIVPKARIDAMQPATYRERWTDNIANAEPGVAFFVGELDGVAAGYGIAGAYRPQEDADEERPVGLGELFAIYVDPPRQRRGVGIAIHDAVLGWLAAAGYGEAALWVLAANAPSIAWYGARGWRRDGATSRWEAAGERLLEVRMRLTLREVTSTRAGRAPPTVSSRLGR